MQKKIDPDSTHGQKIVRLFAKLLFARRAFSLSELAESMKCSKQTILRLMDHIQNSYSVIIDTEKKGKQRYYQIKNTSSKLPVLELTESEFQALNMCKSFTENLLGQDFVDKATIALEKSHALLPNESSLSKEHFRTIILGSIDYTPHCKSIQTLIDSMNQSLICKINYQSWAAESSKIFYIEPLKLFSYKETLYLHARRAIDPEKKSVQSDYDPLLAVHRIKKVELTNRKFEFPHDYNFAEIFNKSFGIIKEDVFEVEVEFSGFAARYVSERIWSPDQKIIKLDDGNIRLIFNASSETETKAWILFFGKEATVIRPGWLREEIVGDLKKIERNY